MDFERSVRLIEIVWEKVVEIGRTVDKINCLKILLKIGVGSSVFHGGWLDNKPVISKVTE